MWRWVNILEESSLPLELFYCFIVQNETVVQCCENISVGLLLRIYVPTKYMHTSVIIQNKQTFTQWYYKYRRNITYVTWENPGLISPLDLDGNYVLLPKDRHFNTRLFLHKNLKIADFVLLSFVEICGKVEWFCFM